VSRAPRRLLFVVNVGWFFLSHRLPIARAARLAGYDVHVAADIEDEAEAQAIVTEGFTFHRINVQRGRRRVLGELGLIRQLASLFLRLRPDIVHTVTVKPVVYGGIAARLTRTRHVVHAISGLGYVFTHGAGSRRVTRVVVSALYRIALGSREHKVIFQNEDDRDMFVSAGIVARAATVLIEGSGVDIDAFRAVPESAGPVTVLLPARILRDKGIHEFADAATSLRGAGVAARFAIAGRLDEANPAGIGGKEFATLCERSGVEWLGFVHDMPALFSGVHIVCLPSYREGLSKTLIEACAAGRPIVASDVTGCREVARHGINALTVPPADARALADALRRLIEDPALRRKFGQAGRTLAERTYDVRTVVARTLSVYEQFFAREY